MLIVNHVDHSLMNSYVKHHVDEMMNNWPSRHPGRNQIQLRWQDDRRGGLRIYQQVLMPEFSTWNCDQLSDLHHGNQYGFHCDETSETDSIWSGSWHLWNCDSLTTFLRDCAVADLRREALQRFKYYMSRPQGHRFKYSISSFDLDLLASQTCGTNTSTLTCGNQRCRAPSGH